MVFGIVRGNADTRKQPLCEELLNAVQKKHPSVKSNSWWEARVVMRSPAPDWRKPEVLWRLHKDGNFLTEVAQQLLEIVGVSELIIDRLSRKYSKGK